MSRLSVILLVAVVVLVALLLRSCESYKNQKLHISSYENLLALERAKTDTWKDNSGKFRARAIAAEATVEAINDYIPYLKDSIDGLNKRNLNSHSVVGTESNGNIETFVVDTVYIYEKDTVYSKHFTYTDKWSTFKGDIIKDKININYNVRDSLTFTSFYKGKTFFSKGQLVVEGKSYNPNTSITGIKEIHVVDGTNKKLSFGPSINYGIVGDGGFTWSFGVGIQYNLIGL